jgi:ribokinase
MLAVVGSLNFDLVLRCPRLPHPGETLLASDFTTVPGGKGANQAYAAARLTTTPVRMIGNVGRDAFGQQLIANLASANVDVSTVNILDGVSTGLAFITVDSNGQNSIVVAPGANLHWPDAFPASLLAEATHVLFQLEIPLPVVSRLASLAKSAGAFTILDPAPAQALPPSLLDVIDLITPNESEAAALGPLPEHKALYKLGPRGSRYQHFRVPAIPVQAVDTTAAGDVYNAALAVALNEKQPWPAAMRFASAAAGLSVTRPGAQSSAPTRAEVDAWLDNS